MLRTRTLPLLLAAAVGAAAVLWMALGPGGDPVPEATWREGGAHAPARPDSASSEGPEALSASHPPRVGVLGVDPAPPPAPEGTFAAFHAAPLELPEDAGPITGAMVVAALARHAAVRFESPGVQQAFEAAVLCEESPEAGHAEPGAAVDGWAQEAGFGVLIDRRWFVIVRLPDRD